MRRILFAALLVIVNLPLTAQSDLSQDGKWEIGLDFLPLIDSSYTVRNWQIPRQVVNPRTGTHGMILVRRVIGERSKLRGRAGISFQEIRDRPHTHIPNRDVVSDSPFQAYLSLGYEQYLKAGNISVYLGADAFGTYYRYFTKNEKDTRPFANPPTIFEISQLYHEYKAGLNLLTGVNIRIVPHLYLSTEAFLQTAYRWQKSDYRQYEGEELELTVWGGRLIKRWIVDLQPVSAIHLIFQF